jgi:diazepam-binding inhibitor (GABA receptor modulating acyl-CoA-binding protein)
VNVCLPATLHAQASVGDNSTSQPWAVQVQARAKWEAWTKNKGMSTADAEAAYIKLATELSEWDAAQ